MVKYKSMVLHIHFINITYILLYIYSILYTIDLYFTINNIFLFYIIEIIN